MENNLVHIKFKDIKDRFQAYSLYSKDELDYSERVARNTYLLFVKCIEKNLYPDNQDLKLENAQYIFEAVKYFDVGHIIDNLIRNDSNNNVPVRHVELGAQIFFKDVRKREDFNALSNEEKLIRRLGKDAALYHREMWDGSGFPDGLKMEEIPLIARMTRLCAELEKLTTLKTNGVAYSKHDAFEKIASLSGREFDPKLTDLFYDIQNEIITKGETGYDVDNYVSTLKAKLETDSKPVAIKNEPKEEKVEEKKKKESSKSKKTTTKTKSEAASKPTVKKTATKKKTPKKEKEVGKRPTNKASREENIREKVQKSQELELTNNGKEKPKFTKTQKMSRPVQMRFNPVVDIQNNEVAYYRSELIINAKYYGKILPAAYSAIAEKSGQIDQLTLIGFEQVVDFIHTAFKFGFDLNKVSVRFYASQFDKDDFFKKIEKIVIEEGIGGRLIFEIPEEVLASRNADVVKKIERFKDLGIGVAIRDFDSEYSSMLRLADLDFDYLIVDAKYSRDIDLDPRQLGIVKSFKDLINAFEVKGVIEGIQTEEQAETLYKIGIRTMQGTLFGEPKTMFEILE